MASSEVCLITWPRWMPGDRWRPTSPISCWRPAARSGGRSRRRSAAYRYRIDDPAFRFYYEFVAPNESLLEVHEPRTVWNEILEDRLDTYMGRVFESMVPQAYRRLRERHGLPLVAEWGRWEGTDREGAPLEVDIAARLPGGGVLTGEIEWNRSELDARVHVDHLAKIERLAAAGRLSQNPRQLGITTFPDGYWPGQ